MMRTAVKCANNSLFLGMAITSHVVKGPIVHFMSWLQANIKKHKARERTAAEQGVAYMDVDLAISYVASGYRRRHADAFPKNRC